ncbi:girdin-like [Daktulosphaira vitifoliae]|uniref:girdin-like n=1 Tax=Daktulosphaira vitifoliae TaxID=58002 RepID=UPI0021AAD0A1|nr:girdin-like [Daktulosphaira vitifoliae]
MILKLKNDVCELSEQLKKIIHENHCLHLQLNKTIDRNMLLKEALKRPAPFKKTAKGFRFPGKIEMEEKLKNMKEEILHLNNQIKEIKNNQQKIKLAKEFFDQYSALASKCECNHISPCSKENLDEIIRIKTEQILQSKNQNTLKSEELKMLKDDLECSVSESRETFDKIGESRSELSKINSQIDQLSKNSEFDLDIDEEGLKKTLKKILEEVDILELTIRNCGDEMYECEISTSKIKEETQEIEKSNKNLYDKIQESQEMFESNCEEMREIYQKQLEQVTAIPVLLSATQRKLQNIVDMRVLTGETCEHLKNELNEEQKNSKPHQCPIKEKEQVEAHIKLLNAHLEMENNELEAKITNLKKKIDDTSSALSNELSTNESIREEIEIISTSSLQQINIMKKFARDSLNRYTNEVKCLKELLTELQSRECENSMMKKNVIAKIKEKTNLLDLTFQKTIVDVDNVLKLLE